MPHGTEKRAGRGSGKPRPAKDRLPRSLRGGPIRVTIRMTTNEMNDLESVCQWLRNQTGDTLPITHSDGVKAALKFFARGLQHNAEPQQPTSEPEPLSPAPATIQAASRWGDCGISGDGDTDNPQYPTFRLPDES